MSEQDWNVIIDALATARGVIPWNAEPTDKCGEALKLVPDLQSRYTELERERDSLKRQVNPLTYREAPGVAQRVTFPDEDYPLPEPRAPGTMRGESMQQWKARAIAAEQALERANAERDEANSVADQAAENWGDAREELADTQAALERANEVVEAAREFDTHEAAQEASRRSGLGGSFPTSELASARYYELKRNLRAALAALPSQELEDR